jgi:hypothetical protein
MDEFYRNRLRSLQAVDEALEFLVDTLVDLRLDDKTYMFYTSDNGQHFGDFRMPAGKRQAYDTDVLVPFLVRGPGIQAGAVSAEIIQSVDLGPTFLDIATSIPPSSLLPLSKQKQQQQKKLQTSYPMDGKSILPLIRGEIPAISHVNRFRWAALLEMYSGSSGVGPRYIHRKNYQYNHLYPNTYQAVRIINGPSRWARNSNWLYVEWCTGEIEFYNVTNDPHQTKNLAVSTTFVSNDDGRDLLCLFRRLNRILSKLGVCNGGECHEHLDHPLDDPAYEIFRATNVSRNYGRRHLMDDLQTSIRNRIPCYNPSNMTKTDRNFGRKPFAYDLYVSEPFEFGFPFSDEEQVPESLLVTWEDYRHYFH